MKSLHFILFLSILATLLACNISSSETKQANEKTPPTNSLLQIFESQNAEKIMTTTGCLSGFYALISDKCVLEFPFSIYRDSADEQIRTYAATSDWVDVKLWQFEKDSANLANICTDIIFVNAPKRKQKLAAIDGNYHVLCGNTTDIGWRKYQQTYILIDSLIFMDTLQQQRIKIEDKLLWEVPELGGAG